jgi:indolepyruvate ferredoxin oxidoreductase alpha subunit
MDSTYIDRQLLSGNEAIARGAWEHGVRVAAAYPGTPSTEILENLATYEGVAAQWSPNEKVALEVAIGASLVGARALVAMKHVGVNVAADPLLTLAYTGVNGGLVLVSADDPGIHSSQNEQDNRFYGRFARVPVLEPSDSAEARDFVGVALDVSERFDTVVILRTTTRVSHSKSIVTPGERKLPPLRAYRKDIAKWVMVPGNARKRQPEVLARQARLEAWVETADINRIEWRDRRIGIVTAGATYPYVREGWPEASVLKLGATYPLPQALIREFAAGVERVMVIEELEPFLYEGVRLAGVEPVPSGLPRVGELSPGKVRQAVGKALGVPVQAPEVAAPADAPVRPPVLCPGCPHRSVFHVLSKLDLLVTGDIGCYTLAALPPLSAMDVFMDMGAAIGMALGAEKAKPEDVHRTVAVIGDSTFLHSGITGLLDMVYNGSRGTVIILDNGTTAMTGHQDHPTSGKTLQGAKAPEVSLEKIAEGVGVRRLRVVNPFDLDALETAIREETAAEEVSVIIARHPCVLLDPAAVGEPVELVEDECVGCLTCTEFGCPAISWHEGHPVIEPTQCGGCGLCVSVCPVGALVPGGERR